ncbi:MAG: serine/threonine protein phosphatase [Sphingopyxis sp.]|nr:serine/threonine protein phosphatase [Sphingopyxis sp.]
MSFLNFFGRRAPAAAAVRPRVEAGRRVYAVGDIHGRNDLLVALLDMIRADDRARGAAETVLILLGDLIDRGPSSAAVLDTAVKASKEWTDFHWLTGNHEEVFAKVLAGDSEALKFFCRIGGEETILSYGVAPEAYRGMSLAELSDALAALVPASHRQFLETGESWVREGDYLFVHAGIRPGVALMDQKASDLRWIRQPFLDDARDHGFFVIHGHTIKEEIDLHPNRLGIDTGAYYTGRLTAVGLEGDQQWFLTT